MLTPLRWLYHPLPALVRLGGERHGFIKTGASLVAETLLEEQPGEMENPDGSADVVAARIRSALRFIWPFAQASASHPQWWSTLRSAAAAVPPPVAPAPEAAPLEAAKRARAPDGRPVPQAEVPVATGAWLQPQPLRDDPLMTKLSLEPMEVRGAWLSWCVGSCLRVTSGWCTHVAESDVGSPHFAVLGAGVCVAAIRVTWASWSARWCAGSCSKCWTALPGSPCKP